MENQEIMEVAANVVEDEKMSPSAKAVMTLAIIGVGTVGYGIGKLAKWTVEKVKSRKESNEPEATEETEDNIVDFVEVEE